MPFWKAGSRKCSHETIGLFLAMRFYLLPIEQLKRAAEQPLLGRPSGLGYLVRFAGFLFFQRAHTGMCVRLSCAQRYIGVYLANARVFQLAEAVWWMGSLTESVINVGDKFFVPCEGAARSRCAASHCRRFDAVMRRKNLRRVEICALKTPRHTIFQAFLMTSRGKFLHFKIT